MRRTHYNELNAKNERIDHYWDAVVWMGDFNSRIENSNKDHDDVGDAIYKIKKNKLLELFKED